MKRLLLSSAALTLLAIGPALAADLPRKAPPAPAVVAPVWNWTGFYIGGNVGGVWQHDDGDSNFVQTTGVLGFANKLLPTNGYRESRL